MLYRKSEHTFYVQLPFPENCAIYELTWENMVETGRALYDACALYVGKPRLHLHIQNIYTRSVRKVSDRIFLCERLMDYNLARLHEPTLNLSAHA